MPTGWQRHEPSLDEIILIQSGRGDTWLSTYEPLTPLRMTLIKQLVGNAQWTKHSKGRKVTWRLVQ
jgi:hypothetical protein